MEGSSWFSSVATILKYQVIFEELIDQCMKKRIMNLGFKKFIKSKY